MKICQVERPLVSTNRIAMMEHKLLQVVRDGSSLAVAVDAVGAKPGDLAGMLYREARLPPGSVGRIALFPKYSLVDVRAEHAPAAIDRCRDAKLRGKAFRIDYDRKA